MSEGVAAPAADDPQRRRLRKGVYAVLIALAAGNMAGRILAVNAVNRGEMEQYLVAQRVAALQKKLKAEGTDEAAIAEEVEKARPEIEAAERRQRPFLSANDRSRWLTIRALVDQGTFEIDGVMDANVWNTIDMVQHRGRDGELHLYSSKPPLLSVVLAGVYWVVQAVTGWTLADNPYEVVRLMLLIVNLAPMVLMLALVARWAERFGTTDWGRVFVVAAASLGTMLTAFAVVVNNHLIAAVSVAIALDAFLRVWFEGDTRIRWFALAGAFSAFAAADELPALSLLALLSAALLARDVRGWLIGFAPAAGVVVAAFFATNYAAHQSWRPPYMHRSETDPDDNWYHFHYTLNGRERPSYWLDPQGIDRGEPSKLTYAVHALVGHHGVFSLTPVWLLSAWGIWLWLRGGDGRLRQVAFGLLLLAVVCLVFYIALRPQIDRNYGGMTSGLRWMFWHAPLWLLVMLPAADRAARSRTGMAVALVLLVFSTLSASYPTWNPWVHPWIYNWLQANGWQPAM
jgi:hypothetical protein